MKFVVCLFMTAAIMVASDNKVNHHATTNLWKEGKIPYEISKQYTSDDTSLIKEVLGEIMKTTCIKFVPRLSESDYSVFMAYKHPDQKRGTCWSGKWNNGASTVGNQNGRHIVSLWPDFNLDCFNKFGILREVLYILGLPAKPLATDEHQEREILYGYLNYEEQLITGVELSSLGTSCRKAIAYLKTHLFALDNKQWSLAAKDNSCYTVRSLIEINRLYNCSDYGADPNYSKSNLVDASKLPISETSVSPDCKAEADAGTCKSDPIYMAQICEKSFCDGTTSTASTTTPLKSTASTTTPMTSAASTTASSTSTASTTTPSTSASSSAIPTTSKAPTTIITTQAPDGPAYYLVNGHGKCLASPENLANSGNPLNTWECGPQKGMLWSYNEIPLGSGNRHICNGHKKCLTFFPNGFNPAQYDHHLNTAQQMFSFLTLSLPGFFVIRSDYKDMCLGVVGNSGVNGAAAMSSITCNPNEAGQRWKWQHM